jgi:adenylate cyclase
VVFVGQTESDWIETHDSFYTAYSGKSGRDLSGVEVAATAFANLMEDRAVYPLAPAVVVLLLMAWGILTALVSLYFSIVVSVLGLTMLCGSYGYAAAVQFAAEGAWYPLVVPILVQAPAALIAGLIWKHRRVSIDRENIREAFGYYVPDEVVDRVATDLKSLRLGGRVFYGICLFTDAQNYTTLSERLDPSSLTELMNDYYEAIFKPIKSHGGLVLQVVGDSVMALWSAPESQPALKRIACRAALEIAAAVDAFNREAGDRAMPTRIGLHAGEMLLGNIGAMDHYEYRPVGDIVNTASRVEGLSKFLGTRLLATRDVVGSDEAIRSRPVGRFVFKGKRRPVPVHELLPPNASEGDRHEETYRHFADGLAAFTARRWDAALECFDRALAIDGDDGPSQFYRQCCRTYRQQPPGDGWDGAVVLEQK